MLDEKTIATLVDELAANVRHWEHMESYLRTTLAAIRGVTVFLDPNQQTTKEIDGVYTVLFDALQLLTSAKCLTKGSIERLAHREGIREPSAETETTPRLH